VSEQDYNNLNQKYQELLVRYNDLQKDFSKSRVEFEKKIIEMEYKYARLADNIDPLKESIIKVHQSISGEAGTTDKIGIIGQLSSLASKIESNNAKSTEKWVQTEKVLRQLQESQKEQNKINMDTAKKYSGVGILIVIVVQIIAHLLGK
jgi:seryl-tRNA synthetase